MKLQNVVKKLYDTYGQQKSMGLSSENVKKPHFYLIRTFLHDNDLLIIFNTKRCSYQCDFCQLPSKSSKSWIPSTDILDQFEYVLTEIKHSLSILDRVTISNEGSVLDERTFPLEALYTIVDSIQQLRRVRTLVLETRLEFVKIETLCKIKELNPRSKINILTGFETYSSTIRDKILNKKESIHSFLKGLDVIHKANATLTSYILYKPDPAMSDKEAYIEAERSIDFLAKECKKRNIPLTIRINPMYVAIGSKWEKLALSVNYVPPRLQDIMKLAETKRKNRVDVYIGLSSEGLDNPQHSYVSRLDYSKSMIKQIILFNRKEIDTFKEIY